MNASTPGRCVTSYGVPTATTATAAPAATSAATRSRCEAPLASEASRVSTSATSWPRAAATTCAIPSGVGLFPTQSASAPRPPARSASAIIGTRVWPQPVTSTELDAGRGRSRPSSTSRVVVRSVIACARAR